MTAELLDESAALAKKHAGEIASVVEPQIDENKVFIPTYRRPWTDIVLGRFRDFWFKGGRASFK